MVVVVAVGAVKVVAELNGSGRRSNDSHIKKRGGGGNSNAVLRGLQLW